MASAIPESARGAEQRAVDDLLARLAERDEVAGEVSTIDRGYVFRIKRTQVAAYHTSYRSGRENARGCSW